MGNMPLQTMPADTWPLTLGRAEQASGKKWVHLRRNASPTKVLWSSACNETLGLTSAEGNGMAIWLQLVEQGLPRQILPIVNSIGREIRVESADTAFPDKAQPVHYYTPRKR
jgi:hypothetical protein